MTTRGGWWRFVAVSLCGLGLVACDVTTEGIGPLDVTTVGSETLDQPALGTGADGLSCQPSADFDPGPGCRAPQCTYTYRAAICLLGWNGSGEEECQLSYLETQKTFGVESTPCDQTTTILGPTSCMAEFATDEDGERLEPRRVAECKPAGPMQELDATLVGQDPGAPGWLLVDNCSVRIAIDETRGRACGWFWIEPEECEGALLSAILRQPTLDPLAPGTTGFLPGECLGPPRN